MTSLLLILVIFFAAFTQSLTGFGGGLVAMSVLPAILGIRVAAPLVSLFGVTIEVVLLLRYRNALRLKAVWRLVLASLVSIPIGILAVRNLDEKIVLTILGLVLTGYALYGLFELRLPELHHSLWAYLAGFLAGLLGGAYNTAGPPVILYGNCRRWLPAEFKGNLQGFFLINSLLVVTNHALSHNLTPLVLRDFLLILPALGVGVLSGVGLDRRLDPLAFRRLVLIVLALMGVRMLVMR